MKVLELLAQRVQLEVASAEEAIDKYRGGILLSSPRDYGYALDDLQRYLSYDAVRSQINEDDAAAAIESLEKLIEIGRASCRERV